MLKKFFEKRKTKRILQKYVTKAVAEAITEGRTLDFGKNIKAGTVDFLLVFLQGESAEKISERMADVVDLAIRHNGVVDGMISSLVVIVFGTLPERPQSSFSRKALVDELLQKLGDSIKIVHGTANGHFGVFGGSTRYSYTFLVPKFDAALARLGQIEFGKVEEFFQ